MHRRVHATSGSTWLGAEFTQNHLVSKLLRSMSMLFLMPRHHWIESLGVLNTEDAEPSQEIDGVSGELLQLGLLDVDLGDKVLDAGEGVAVDAKEDGNLLESCQDYFICLMKIRN